jgi:hypothetical protein
MTHPDKLIALIDECDVAYRAMRTLVIDRLPPGTSPDTTPLGIAQQMTVDRFQRAERELADYRAAMYESWAGLQPA